MDALSTRFISAHNRTDDSLRRVAGIGADSLSRSGYLQVLNEAAKRSALVRANRDDLLEFNDLRNAIVHRLKGYAIAEPHPEVVSRLEEIADLLEKPPLVTRFLREVVQLNEQDSVSKALSLAKEHGYSQFPVLRADRGFVGLLSDRCMARWLAASVKDDLVSLGETKVSEVIEHDETRGTNVEFLSRQATTAEALELFTRAPARLQPVMDAVIITEHGKRSERPIGIITPWDIAELLSEAKTVSAR